MFFLPEKKFMKGVSGTILHTAYICNKDDRVSPSVPLFLWPSSILEKCLSPSFSHLFQGCDPPKNGSAVQVCLVSPLNERQSGQCDALQGEHYLSLLAKTLWGSSAGTKSQRTPSCLGLCCIILGCRPSPRGTTGSVLPIHSSNVVHPCGIQCVCAFLCPSGGPCYLMLLGIDGLVPAHKLDFSHRLFVKCVCVCCNFSCVVNDI